MNQAQIRPIPLSPYTAPRATTFGYTGNRPEDFYYDPSLYNYMVSKEGKIQGSLRPGALAKQDELARQRARASYSPSRPRELPILRSEQPTPRLLPSERREIAEGAVMRGFSPVSRSAAPRIATKIAGDVEEEMMEQQQQRIRDQIVNELLSLYMSPRRYSDTLQRENLERQLAMLDELYGQGGA